jgi:uncharacterized protein (TIGR03437 family)
LHFPMIYNDADIDRSTIVWAHETDREHDRELINYYKNRTAWIFNPDVVPFRLVPLVGPAIIAVTNGAGLRDDRQQGVSPGGIALILGVNFVDGGDKVLQARSVLHGFPFVTKDVSEKTGEGFEPLSTPSPAADAEGNLTFRLGDVSVEFNNIPAPIFSVSKLHGQESVTVQVPFDVAVGPAVVTVHVLKHTATENVSILPVTPGIFEIQRGDSSRQAIILRQDGSLVDLQHPARRGESLRCLATGLGPLSATGAVAHSMAVGIHNAGVPFLYARSAPGLVGVEEIGFQVPPEAPSGKAQPFAISVSIDGKPVYGNSSWIPVE